MCVLRVDGVMDGHFSPAHQELITLLMVHNLRKPARRVHWATSVRTVAQSTTNHMSVQQGITVPWELNFKISSLALRAHTTLMSTSHPALWLAYLVVLVITA